MHRTVSMSICPTRSNAVASINFCSRLSWISVRPTGVFSLFCSSRSRPHRRLEHLAKGHRSRNRFLHSTLHPVRLLALSRPLLLLLHMVLSAQVNQCDQRCLLRGTGSGSICVRSPVPVDIRLALLSLPFDDLGLSQATNEHPAEDLPIASLLLSRHHSALCASMDSLVVSKSTRASTMLPYLSTDRFPRQPIVEHVNVGESLPGEEHSPRIVLRRTPLISCCRFFVVTLFHRSPSLSV